MNDLTWSSEWGVECTCPASVPHDHEFYEMAAHSESDHNKDCHGYSGNPSSYCGGCWGCLAMQAAYWAAR